MTSSRDRKPRKVLHCFAHFLAFIGGNDYDYPRGRKSAFTGTDGERKGVARKVRDMCEACKFSNLFADSKFLGKEKFSALSCRVSMGCW